MPTEILLWIVSNADIGLIFGIPPEDIWRELLIRARPAFACLQKPKSGASLNLRPRRRTFRSLPRNPSKLKVQCAQKILREAYFMVFFR